MRIIAPSHEILTPIDGVQILKHIESCGRICYKSEHKITEDSYLTFVKNIIKRGHEAVLEHFSVGQVHLRQRCFARDCQTSTCFLLSGVHPVL